MKRYRIAYNEVFVPRDKDKGFLYKGEQITGLSIYFVYKAIDIKTKEEKCFKGPELKEIPFYYNEKDCCFINHFYKCIVQPGKGYVMIQNKRLQKESNYNIEYEIGKCYKQLSNQSPPVQISYEEFLDILKTNIKEFDNKRNIPTQSTAHYYHTL